LQYLDAAMFAYAEGYVSKVRFAHDLPLAHIFPPDL